MKTSPDMRSITPGEIPTRDLHQFLLGCVAPRPIAFVSTIDEDGRENVAPYSFFNAFSSNPPIVVFSSNRRVVDNTTKDTLANIISSKECVVNVVSHDIVQQMAVASIQYDHETSEFVKSGLTPMPSDIVKPPRVAESPAHLECQVQDIITLGEHGGAGHLIICKVVKMHVAEAVIDERGRIDPNKIDLVGRMGRAFYTRASGDAVFTLFQPVTKIAIGFDQLPKHVQESRILTGNQIGKLAGLFELPSEEDVTNAKNRFELSEQNEEEIHRKAAELIESDDAVVALAVLMAF